MDKASALAPLVTKLELWTRLGKTERTAIMALPVRIERLGPNTYIAREGQETTSSCLLISGFAIRHKILGDGSRSISAVQMRGDVVDLQNSLLRRADHNVQTVTNAEVAFIPREAITRLATDHPRLMMAMWYDTLVDASIFREWIANIARRDGPARLAHLLCEFGLRLEAVKLGKRTDYDLPLTQEQLADATGMTPVHVNRVLRDLAARGLITRSIRAVGIADWDALKKAADFDPAYLHLHGRVELLGNGAGAVRSAAKGHAADRS